MKIQEIVKLSGLVCVLILFAGCALMGNDETEFPEPIDFLTLSQDSTLLVGTWQWKRTTNYGDGSGTPTVRTPESTGQTETLIVTQDGSVKVYQDDELTHEMTYEKYLDGASWGVSEDLFAWSIAYRDGPESLYEREK